ncbi:MAG: hypothetical protein EBU49_12075, partial [Proteobacteria bacterium]|nr:hypothetical protein [Pseudomonadota bacterium]
MIGMATLNRDGKKRSGRYIKGNDRLMNHVSIGNYSFEEICTSPIASFDNEDATIIHARLHTAADLEKTVRSHPKFDQKLKPQDGDRSVIKPVDFTPEWNQVVSPSTGRRRRIGRGDDAMELSDEGQRELALIFGGDVPAPVAADLPAKTSVSADGPVDVPLVDAESVLERESGSFRINREESGSDSFIPLETGGTGETAATVEAAAADAWKVRKDLEQEMQKAVAEAKDAAVLEGRKTGYDAGYQEGFRSGEEKGELGARQTASQFFGRAGDLIREFESLKGQILDNVQQNFFDLCQAMGEALLEREFEIRPDSF